LSGFPFSIAVKVAFAEEEFPHLGQLDTMVLYYLDVLILKKKNNWKYSFYNKLKEGALKSL